MAGRDEQQAAESPGLKVPDLIEQYRIRRKAWMAQADELSRMRDEVRDSAEREAMEIVAAARREVRRIAMEARRELLVLSAQVQAALGEAPTPPAPTQLLAGNTSQAQAAGDTSLSKFVPEKEWRILPNASVRSVLEEARTHITALAEEARAVSVIEPAHSAAPAPAPVLTPAPALVGNPHAPLAHHHTDSTHITPGVVRAGVTSNGWGVDGSWFGGKEPDERRIDVDLGALDSSVLAAAPVLARLPSPAPSVFPEASTVPVPPPFQSRRFEVPDTKVRTVVTLCLVAAVALVLGTVWMMNQPSSPGLEPPRVDASAGESSALQVPPTAAPTAPAASVPDAPATTEKPGSLSVLIDARRPAWIRAIVDGRADAGRTLEAGVKYEVRGTHSVSLRVGDAGAVMVSVNSGEPRSLGGDGQVVSRLYTVDQPVPSTGK